jgi:CHAT domain-containing protein
MNPEELFEAFRALLEARSEGEALQVLQEHPELLDKEVDLLLQQLASQARKDGDANAAKLFAQWRELLRTARSPGTTAYSPDESELSNIMKELSRPAQLADMPRRIALCRRALELVSREQNAEMWAYLQNVLGTNLAQSPIGYRADNIEQSIKCFEQAIEIRTRNDFPEQWAATQNNLAIAFTNRILGDRADNIEQSIKCFKKALEIRTRNDSPDQWAATQNNLAVSYQYRIRGDRANNIEESIKYFQQALSIYSLKFFPEQWAMTKNNLGATYNNRILGEHAHNIEKAIQYFEEALKVYKREAFPENWAETQNNLGLAYNNRIYGDKAINIDMAIRCFKKALLIYEPKTFPEQWAMAQNNLANAYCDCIRSDQPDKIECAISCYNQALNVYSEKKFPLDWAMIQNNLALIYRDRIYGNPSNNIELSIKHFKEALRIYKPKEIPNYCRVSSFRLGNLCLERQRFSESGEAYTKGIEAAEELYRASIFQASKEAELAETGDLYRRAGYALANSNRLREAAVALEKGRARILGDALARDRAELERIREKDSQAYELYRLAVEELQTLESQERAGGFSEKKALPARDLMMQARARLDGAVNRIRQIPGYESFLREPSWEEIAAAAVEDQPLVYIAAAPCGGVALIVHRSSGSGDASVETVFLDSFSEDRLQEHLKIWFDAYDGWKKALHDVSLDYGQAESRWFKAIESVTGNLWIDAIGPIYAALQALNPDQAFLIPTGLLAFLPLHAAWRVEGGRREYLQDLLPVSYIPSARALAYARRIAGVAGNERLLAIYEPRLPSSEAEVSAISSYFHSPLILAHEKASRAAVLQALPKAEVVHFSCHGGANWNDPENSGLLMANDEILTIKDLFELHLDRARLASLSACETGIPGTKLPDEVVSLPSAFIRAGFAGAIGSLWTVRDDSTALLMTSFYQLWREKGMPPAQALAQAQKELREQEKFQHPFYWAAFYMTGI